MRLEINDDDFHAVNEFNNFFEFEYPICASLTETASSELDRRCKNLKDKQALNKRCVILSLFCRCWRLTAHR